MDDNETYTDAGDVEAMVIDVDTTDAIEAGPVPSNEYKLMCIKAEGAAGIGKTGKRWKAIKMLFDIPDEITAQLVNHMQFLPSPDGTEKEKAQAIGRFAGFKEAFGFHETETFTPNDLVGKEVWATLSLTTDPEYGDQNKIQRFITSQG